MSNTTVIRNETQSCKDSRMHHFWIWILLNLILSYRNLKRKEDFQKLGSYSILKFIFWPPVFWLFSRPKLTRKLIYEGALQSSGSPLDDGQSDFENWCRNRWENWSWHFQHRNHFSSFWGVTFSRLTYEESPWGAASGLSRCNFFRLQTSLLSLFLVKMG